MSKALLDEASRLHRAGELERAERVYQNVLRAEPRNLDALFRLGFLHGERGHFDAAQRRMGEAIALAPNSADAHFLRGYALLKLERQADALNCFDRTIALNPRLAEAHLNRAVTLNALGRPAEALSSAERCVALQPRNVAALVTSAVALERLNRTDEAKAVYDRALVLDPRCIDALVNRASLLAAEQRYGEAAADCDRVLTLDPDFDYMRGFALYFHLRCCDWRGLAQETAKIEAAVEAGRRAIQPFMHLAVSDSSNQQLRCADIWAANECCVAAPPLWQGQRYQHSRLRIAYLSEHFGSHPVAQQIAGVLEQHDKTRFEIIGISSGRDDGSALRGRIVNACDRFIDVSGRSDLQIAQMLRAEEIDVAVDLMGYTGTARSKVLAYRPASAQASWLGYPGSMGADWIDYLIADKTAIGQGDEIFYREKIARLPHSSMATDRARTIAERTPSRGEAGLPEIGFVFCCFNNGYKILPEMFDIWMRLLQRVSGSVLWLSESNAAVKRNLAREAEARGISSTRLIFAPRLSRAEDHLARHRLADLFLDTLPYNAHATAADALWAGLPVLTCKGATFAGRAAASMLLALGLPELVTPSLEEYEALAVRLASDPSLLESIKSKVETNRDTQPLFDTTTFTRHLEAAYTAMCERAKAGLPPESFEVPSRIA